MAQADGVVANGTGAAVRADLNDQLAAVFTNHSGSSEPATTYAYQWWADTTANVLKIRNSANNAWITLRELDGTLLMEDGSASTPGLAFADDVNTGIFSPAADQIGFATGGVERLEIGSSEVVFNDPSNDVDFRVESNGNTHMLFVDAGNDRVGIAESAPAAKLHVSNGNSSVTPNANADELFVENNGSAGITIGSANTHNGRVAFGDEQNAQVGLILYDHTTDNLRFDTSGSEAFRIDSDGRLLVGASSSQGSDRLLQVASTGSGAGLEVIRYTTASGSAPSVTISKSNSDTLGTNTLVDNGDAVGYLQFKAANGSGYNTAAQIYTEIDGSPNLNDMPGRLILATTADGASSATERFRIDSEGTIKHTGLRAGAGENKLANYTVPSHNTNEEDVLVFTVANESSSNQITFGGGPSAYNAATEIVFRTASAVDTTVGSEAMRINSSGKLLIGSSTESALGDRLLQVGSTSRSASYISIVNSTSGTGGLLFADATNDTDGGYRGQVAYQHSTDAMQFWTAGSERMRITNNGRLDVFASSSTDAHFISSGASAGTSIELLRGMHSAGAISAGTASLRIYTNGNIQNTNGSYGSISDVKLKENIVDANSQWDDIKGIQVRNYNFKEETGHQTHTQIGVVAQEIETVSPGLVYETPDKDDDGTDLGTVTKSVNYSVLYMKAVKALQEAMDRIETLETKVAALEAG